MITYLLAQLVLASFNLMNAVHDAFRIKAHKRIYHGLNFVAYAVLCGALCWAGKWDFRTIILSCVAAFCNRQLSFDIPLNQFRGLKWDYVSTERPPKSITDRIEIRLFGYNGRAPFLLYGVVWGICLIIKIFS